MVSKRMLGRDEILAVDDLKTTVVEVPEWGGCVKVRELSAGERGHVESSILALDVNGNMSLRDGADVRGTMCDVVYKAAIKDDDTPLFVNASDLKRLTGKNANAIQRIYDAVMELSGVIGEENTDEDKRVGPGEEPGDESSGGPSASSPPTISP